MLYLDEEERRTQKWEHYAVRIIASILRIFSANPDKIKENEMYVRYEELEKVKPKKTKEERIKEAYAHASAVFGINFGKMKKKDK